MKADTLRTLCTRALPKLLFVFAALASANTWASHFHGGSITWQSKALDGDGVVDDVEITVKAAYRYNYEDPMGPQGTPLTITKSDGQELIFNDTPFEDSGIFVNGNASGADYYLQTTVFRVNDLDPNETYLVVSGSSARISTHNGGTLHNNANGAWKIQSTIHLKDGNLAPKIDWPIWFEVPRLRYKDGSTTETESLANFTFDVSATDPNADKIRYRLANTDELGGGSSTNPPGMSIDANTGTMTWAGSGSMATGYYSMGIVVEDIDAYGKVKSKSHVDFLLWLQDKVAVGFTIGDEVPDSRNIIVEKGDVYNFTVTGVAVDVSSLGDVEGALTEGNEGEFTFNPGDVGQGLDPGTYPIAFEVVDKSGAGDKTKNYLILNFIVPDPRAPKIDNIEGDITIYSDTDSLLVDQDQNAVVSNLASDGIATQNLNDGYIRFNVTFTDGQYENLGIKSNTAIQRTEYEVFYDGTKIGDIDPFEDGIGQALRVNFVDGGAAPVTPEAVQALVQSLTYTDTFLLRASGQRDLSLFIQDMDGLNRNYSLYVDVEDHPDKPESGAPVQVNNRLSISNGETVTIGTDNLTFKDADTAAAGITLTATGISNGRFQLTTAPGNPITSFTQAQVNAGQIQFVHTNPNLAPAYNITAFDGTTSVGPFAAAISFTGASSNAVSVFENSIGVLIVPSDGVVGTPTFAITGGSDSDKFNVGASSGSLAFKTAPNFESPADANSDNIYEVEVTVTGSTSGSQIRTIIVTLLNVNEAPTISGTPATTIAENAAYSFTPTGADVDAGTTLTYSVTGAPDWASLDPATGELSGVPGFDDAGTSGNIIISVSDGTSSASLTAFTITVTNTNQAPTISGTPAATVAENAAYSFTPTGADADAGTTLTYSVTGEPDWASFDPATGQLSGTPGYDDAGTSGNITISVSDGEETVALPAFTITVTNTNRAPTISGTPATTVAEDAAYSFTPTGADADTGTTLTYSVTGEPDWASFDLATGQLSGTPGYDDAGTSGNITISVSDGEETAALPAFTITVTNTNREPTVDGQSLNVVENILEVIVLTGSDADGDAITYSIVDGPQHGALTGTPPNLVYVPDADFVGSDSFTVKVNDGSADSSIATINLSVLADVDNDGLADVDDPNNDNPDTDGDGIPDGADVNVDGDGTDDNGTDSDGDGINDESDLDNTGGTDSDGDGIDDGHDTVDDTQDTDNDGLPDDLDPDSNNPDTDGDGIPDGADVDVDGDGTNDNG
ncbi:MAG TPA: putative Ig domain-containing protein, partial [Cellvibrio sp.]|nr:putative Ig domain-containing protein [Cellvibrio sp.]